MSKEHRSAWVLFIFVLTGLYRFNTMGGAYGGFDNDEFLSLAYAKQVEAGQQPLRDFLDGGLQGARPSLTYELSAMAQRLLGDNLRSEAVMTIGGMALAAAVTSATALRVATLPWAIGWTSLAFLLAPKLYGYPKILVIAVASWLIVTAGGKPIWRRVVMMAVWTAIGFLFRHDYALYCGFAFALALVGMDARSRVRTSAVVSYACLTLILLTPSLLWVQKYGGVAQYLRNGLAMSQREIDRTSTVPPSLVRLAGESPLVTLNRPENQALLLRGALVAIPWVFVLLMLWGSLIGQRRPEDSALLALAGMAVLINVFFLRGEFEGRLGDAAPPTFILAAVASTRLTLRRPREQAFWWIARATPVILVFALTASKVLAIGTVRHELIVSGISESPAQVIRRAGLASNELLALPSSIWDKSNQSFGSELAAYLHQCTRHTDRVLIMAYAADLFVLSDRLFAGGRATVLPGFYTGSYYDQFTIGQFNRESVPIILTENADRYNDDYPHDFPLLDERLKFGYRDAGPLRDRYHDLRVFVRLGTLPHGRFGSSDLPCW